MMLCNPIIGKFDKSDKIGQFLDQGPTILLSFGSVAKAHTMPKEKADMFLGLFEKLKPFQVIWKWENKGKRLSTFLNDTLQLKGFQI